MKFVMNDKYNVPKIQQLKMIRLLQMGFWHRFCKPTQSTIAFLLMTLITTNVYGQKKFKITLLGTGTPAPSIERFGSSTLIEAGSETLLFDVGRGTTQRLWQLGIPLRQVTDVFLTHFHSDHTVGLPDLWLTGWLPAAFGQRIKPLHIWGGHGVKRFTKNLQKAYQTDIKMRIINESINLAKFFGADGSHRYVNGILDKVAQTQRAEEISNKRKPEVKTEPEIEVEIDVETEAEINAES